MRLSDRDLNRATLARQLLLDRAAVAPLDAVAHLVGLQAQVPLDPYLALWSRLDPFDPHVVGRHLTERRLVRIVCLRGTIHLVTADDAVYLRPLAQPVLDREIRNHRDHRPVLEGLDLAPVLAFGRQLFAEPRTVPAARKAFAEQFPGLEPASLVFACRNHLALVQVPPRGVWGEAAQVTLCTTGGWLGAEPLAAPSVDEAVLRYLAAFGPALVGDVAAWSGLQALREVLDRLRPELRTFEDERGRELFDVPDAPRPDPDTPAPVRFLPEYDNVLLSHSDRTRFGADERVRALWAAQRMKGSILHDGRVQGAWRIERSRDSGVVILFVHHAGLTERAATAVATEGRRAVRFLEPDATGHEVRLVDPG